MEETDWDKRLRGGIEMVRGNYSREFYDGWNDLFEKLLTELAQYDVEVAEAKEKYGTLTVYAYSENHSEEAMQYITKYG